MPQCRASRVVAPVHPGATRKGLLKTAIRDDNPVVFLEAETLYGIKGEVLRRGRGKSPSRQGASPAKASTSPS